MAKARKLTLKGTTPRPDARQEQNQHPDLRFPEWFWERSEDVVNDKQAPYTFRCERWKRSVHFSPLPITVEHRARL